MSAFDPTGLFVPEEPAAEPPDGPPVDPIVQQMLAERQGAAPAATAAPTVDPIVQEMLEEHRRATEQQTQLVRWRAANDKTDPGVRADVLRYSAASGLAPDFVAKNLDQVKREVDASQVNWAEVAQRQPVLLKYLTDDPSVQPLVQDDVANLRGLEWAITAPFVVGADAVREQETIFRQFLEAEGLGSDANQRAIRELEAKFAGKTYGAETWLEKAWIGIPRMLPMIAGDVAFRALGAVAGAAVAGGSAAAPAAAVGAAATAPAGGVGAAPAAVVAGTTAAVPGAIVGQFVGSGIFNYAESVGPLYWRLSQLKGADGRPIDPAVARALAQGGAMVNGVLGAALLGKVGSSLPGVRSLLEKVTGRTVQKALEQQSTARAIGHFAKRYGETALSGATMMAAQSAVNQVAEESAKGLTGGEARLGQVADAAGEAFITGLQDMTLLAAIGPGQQFLRDLGRARRGAESAARLERLQQATTDSKLLERYPEKFRELVVRMKQEGKTSPDVLIPVEAWRDYWSKQKLDPAEVAAAVVEDGGKSYAEALQSNGDVRIPLEHFLSKIVRSDHGEALLQDSRLFADAPTPRQYAEEQKRRVQQMREEYKRRQPEVDDGRKQVFEAFRDEAIKAGVKKAEAEANAKLVSEFAGTMALRTGLSVQEVATTAGLSRLRILAGRDAAIAAKLRLETVALGQPSIRRVRSILREEMKAADAPRIIGDGRIVGAPDGRSSMAELEQLVRNVLGYMRHPFAMAEQSAEWYERSGREIARLTHGDADLFEKTLRLFAFHSGANEVSGNTTAVIKSLMKLARGELLEAGRFPNVAAEALPQILQAPEFTQALPHVSDKIENFYRNLKDAALGTDTWAEASTMDRWMMRLFGYPERDQGAGGTASKLSATQYRYAQFVTRVVGRLWEEETGQKLLPRQVQAVLWTYAKNSADAEVAKAEGKEFTPTVQDFSDTLARATAQVTWETVPSTKLHDLSHLTFEQKRRFHREAAALIFDESGNDLAVRMLLNTDKVLRDYVEGEGAYEGAVSPNGISQILLEKGQAKYATEFADKYAALIGYIYKQDAVPWFRPDKHVPRGTTGVLLELPRRLDPREEDRLLQHLNRSFGRTDLAFTVVGNDLYVLNFTDLPNKKFLEGMDAALDSANNLGLWGDMPDFPYVDFQAETSYISNDWKEQPNGEGYQARLGTGDAPGLLQWADHRRAAFEAIVRRYEAGGEELRAGERGLGEGELRAAEGVAPPPDVGKLQSRGVREPHLERGQVVMRLDPAGRPVSFDIELLRADKSTLAHETAHVLSWSLHELAATSEAVRADYEGLLKFAGYESAEERLAANRERARLLRSIEDGSATDADRTRLKDIDAKEERISHAWEQYLSEGRSPSKALEGVFRRFKTWLRKVYEELVGGGVAQQYEEQYGQPLNFNPEVRAIFDRMLATDDAIAEAKGDLQPDPVAAERMTPAERAAYERALAEAQRQAEEQVSARAAEIAQQRAGRARARIEAEVALEVDRDPAHRATRFLRSGELVEGGRVLKGSELPFAHRKLNRKAAVKQFGPDVVRKLPRGIFAEKKDEGMLPGTAAVQLGFEDSRSMVAALLKAGDRDEVIAGLVEERLDREFGPALRLVQEAGMRAAGSMPAARTTLLELRALAKQVNPEVARRVNSLSLDLMRETAQAIVGDTKLIDLEPAEARRRERVAALEAAELWGEGKREEAIDKKELRLLNQVLFIEARDRKEELTRARKLLRRVTQEGRARLGKADPEIRNLHDAILGAVGLGERASANLDRALEVARSWGEEIDFDVEQLRGVLQSPRPWEILTVAEAQNVRDAVVNLRRIATHRAEVDLAGKRQAREDFFAEMGRRLAKRKALPPQAYESTSKTFWERLRAIGRGGDSLLADVETLATILDSGDRDGPMHRLLIDARVEARTTEVRLAKDVLEKVEQLWSKMPREIRALRDETVDLSTLLPSPNPRIVRPPETRATLWMLFLNWGNEGNRQRIRDGNGWTDENVDKALSILTEPELEFLQGILDAADSLYPELARVHERRTGLQLPKVSATPVTIGGKTYRGGYFPLRYDRRFSRPGELQAAETVESLFGSNYTRPAVSASSRKARVEKVNAPVSMEWGVVPAHFAQVIHDVAYGDYVREAGSIFLDQRFKTLVMQYLGEERNTFIPWLRDVANARADSSAGEVSKVERSWGNWTRRIMANTALAYNVPNQLQGLLDAFRAPMEGVAFHRVAAAYVKTMNPAGWSSFDPFRESKEIDLRSGRIMENMRRRFAEIAPGSQHPTLRAIEETGFRLYALTDAFGSRVTFRAAYEQALSQGRTHEEAVRFGDDVVRKLFPTHDVAEKPPLLRSRRGIAAMLMFHTWANRNYNILRRSAEGENRGAAVATLAARALYFGLVGAGSAYLIGRGPTKEEDTTDWLFTRVALEPLNTLPIVGGVVESKIRGHQVNVRAAPEVAVAVDTIDKIGRLVAKWQKGDASAGEKALAMVELAGIGGAIAGAPVPLGQIHRTGSYLQQLADREQRPRGPFDVARGLAYGPVRRERPADPLTNVQDLLAGR